LPIPAAAAPLPAAGQIDQTNAQTGQQAGDDPGDAPGDAPGTPTPEAEAASPIVDLHATAGRLRGRIELGWRYAAPNSSPADTAPADTATEDPSSAGSVFVVERSTNGSTWRPVRACYLPLDAEVDSYTCMDSRLASGTTYAYRVCLAAKPTTCSNALVAGPVSVKAP
jgi:hypothetical protein